MQYITLYLTNLLELFVDMALYIMIGLFTVGILNAFVNKKWLTSQIGDESIWSVIKASVIGVPLPLCSCGVVPMSIELKKAGGSNGAVVSFLTSTPQTGVDSIIATYGMLGWFMALYRAIASFVSGIMSGIIVNIFGKSEQIKEIQSSCCGGHAEEVVTSSCCGGHTEEVATSSCCGGHTEETTSPCGCSTETKQQNGLITKLKTVFTYGFGSFLDEIAGRFVVGLLISALISTLIPEDFFLSYGLNNQFLSMILMVIIGLPMYICSTSSIPVAVSLIAKGLTPGAAFVFLFVGPVTNMASLVMITKALGKKITILYVTNAIIMAMIFGYLLQIIINLNLFEFAVVELACHTGHGSMFANVLAVIFAGLLIKSFIKKVKA